MSEILSISSTNGPVAGQPFTINGDDFGFTPHSVVFAPNDNFNDMARQVYSGVTLTSWTDHTIIVTPSASGPNQYSSRNHYIFVVGMDFLPNVRGFRFNISPPPDNAWRVVRIGGTMRAF